MLNLTTIIEPSQHVKDRAKHLTAVQYDVGQYTISFRVTPDEHQPKDERLVLFDLLRRTADCLSLKTGEVCEANSFGKLCCHVYAASLSMESANEPEVA
jgi:hypothetical protein